MGKRKINILNISIMKTYNELPPIEKYSLMADFLAKRGRVFSEYLITKNIQLCLNLPSTQK